jgi:NAD(P)-dependent dehydrogenase (short-subunit alcohol dehydrogenase family)
MLKDKTVIITGAGTGIGPVLRSSLQQLEPSLY